MDIVMTGSLCTQSVFTTVLTFFKFKINSKSKNSNIFFKPILESKTILNLAYREDQP